MTLEKWFDKINLVIREVIKDFNEEYDCRMGADFTTYLDEDVIEWTLIYSEQAGDAFYKNFIERYPTAEEFSFFLLSILHEIGHLETEWEMVDDIKERNSKLTNEQYFNLFNERIATDWAGKWIENNYAAARCIDKKFSKILNEFYKEVLD